MKLAIIVQLFTPRWLAGTEIATHSIARHLALRGHEVHVLTSLDKGLLKEKKDQGFWVHRLSVSGFGRLGLVAFWLKSLIIINKIQPDVVHAQNIGMGMPAFLVKLFLHKPYVVWGQGSDVYAPWLFKKPISKLVMRNADMLIALTDDMSKEMHKICDKPIITIPNGIDLDNFKCLAKENARFKLNIHPSVTMITFIGTLRPIKGLKYLIQAMHSLTKINPSVKLMLVGDGTEKQELVKLTDELGLKEKVIFVGKVPNNKIVIYLSASDIFVLPSLSEGFPLVILEAMACGLPIVTTKVRGLPEIVIEGKNGFIVEPKNTDQLVSKIQMLINSQTLRNAISENNKKQAKLYSWQKITKDLEDVYLSVLESRNI